MSHLLKRDLACLQLGARKKQLRVLFFQAVYEGGIGSLTTLFLGLLVGLVVLVEVILGRIVEITKIRRAIGVGLPTRATFPVELSKDRLRKRLRMLAERAQANMG